MFDYLTGLVKGYMAEKQTTDECVRSLENRNEALIQETERLRARLREHEDRHEQVVQREQDVAHQQEILDLSVDDARKGMCHSTTGESSGVSSGVLCFIIFIVIVVYGRFPDVFFSRKDVSRKVVSRMVTFPERRFLGGHFPG